MRTVATQTWPPGPVARAVILSVPAGLAVRLWTEKEPLGACVRFVAR
jgi:hypothetical protein